MKYLSLGLPSKEAFSAVLRLPAAKGLRDRAGRVTDTSISAKAELCQRSGQVLTSAGTAERAGHIWERKPGMLPPLGTLHLPIPSSHLYQNTPPVRASTRASAHLSSIRNCCTTGSCGKGLCSAQRRRSHPGTSSWKLSKKLGNGCRRKNSSPLFNFCRSWKYSSATQTNQARLCCSGCGGFGDGVCPYIFMQGKKTPAILQMVLLQML